MDEARGGDHPDCIAVYLLHQSLVDRDDTPYEATQTQTKRSLLFSDIIDNVTKLVVFMNLLYVLTFQTLLKYRSRQKSSQYLETHLLIGADQENKSGGKYSSYNS